MEEKQLVTCVEQVWSNEKRRMFYVGVRAEINPESPLAKYFDGWKPGTVVYTKEKGKEGTRIIPGGEKVKEEKLGEEPTGKKSGEESLSAPLRSHKRKK